MFKNIHFVYNLHQSGCDLDEISKVFMGPEISSTIPTLYKNSIRALCNANTSEGFNRTRYFSIPEVYLPHGTTKGLLGGPSPSIGTTIVFFSGGVHGYIH
ncbi:putative xylogalacturonan beta-1,3-xylosyltransferase [Helianthus anomalus]